MSIYSILIRAMHKSSSNSTSSTEPLCLKDILLKNLFVDCAPCPSKVLSNTFDKNVLLVHGVIMLLKGCDHVTAGCLTDNGGDYQI